MKKLYYLCLPLLVASPLLAIDSSQMHDISAGLKQVQSQQWCCTNTSITVGDETENQISGDNASISCSKPDELVSGIGLDSYVVLEVDHHFFYDKIKLKQSHRAKMQCKKLVLHCSYVPAGTCVQDTILPKRKNKNI